PAFVLLSGSFFTSELTRLIPMAVAVELVHMATLVHDDVVDNSEIRRGRETVKSKYGNRLSIYAGDYIFARSLALVSTYNKDNLVRMMAEVSTKVCLGEVIQMRTVFDVEQNFKDYFKRIERKTALLMAVSCQAGAEVADASPKMVDNLRRYGYDLGMAFQITDDILDYMAEESVMGKPTGSDIQQGIITLTAIYALRFGEHRQELAEILKSPEKVEQDSERALQIIRDSGGIDYSYGVAARFVLRAQNRLNLLPESEAKTAMLELADFIYERSF
ncbi:MAG: polyprenyl synthetase family protein, partial [Acidobacteriota bacterium]